MSRSKKQLGKQDHLDRAKRVEAIKRQARKEHKHNRGEADAVPTGYRDECDEEWESLWQTDQQDSPLWLLQIAPI